MPYFKTDRRNRLYYELIENQDAHDTLIFIHGWAETHKIWREQIEYFKDSHQILTLDLRGFGLSSKPTYGYALKLQSKYLSKLVHALQLENYWLIGHSLGGMVTLQYCDRYFEVIKGAILIDTTYYLPTKFSTIRNLGAFFISKTMRQIWQRSLRSLNREHQQTLIRELIYNVDSVPLYVSAAYGMAAINLRLKLQKITCPVLIIVGENDELTPVELSKRMHQKLPNSQLSIVKETGHMSFIEKPNEINAIIAQFLQ
ncbi:MAG: alpha/beta fold hydrolase [Candidatus Helarchaeota archaeon]